MMLYYKSIVVMDFVSMHINLAYMDLEDTIRGCQHTLYVA